VALLAAGLLVAGLLEHQRVAARERVLLAKQAGVMHDNLGMQLEAINNAMRHLQADQRKGLDGADGHARLMERMHNFADAMPAVRTFSLLDADGRVLASSAADLVGRDLSGREYFQTAKQIGQTDALLVGQPFFACWAGCWYWDAPCPGDRRGGLLVALDVEHFQTLAIRALCAGHARQPEPW
jgi:hypothetical protein